MADMREVLRQLMEDEARRADPAYVAAQRRRFNHIGAAALRAAQQAMEEMDGEGSEELGPDWRAGRSGTFNV